MGVLLGVVCGLATAAPLINLLYQEQPKKGRGVVAAVLAFLLALGAMFVVRTRWRAELIPFGTTSALVFLLAVVVAAIVRERRR